MFANLFKREKSNNITEDVLLLDKSSIRKYSKEVEEIHHEFETASDKLVEQALNIINAQPVVNESKIERLAKFGFKQVKELIESTEILKITSLSKEQIELVKYFKQHYPFNKFITEGQVKQICHKYNLVCGDVGRFTGFVPNINLQQIESFKLKESETAMMIGLTSTGEYLYFENALTVTNGEYGHLYKKDKCDYYNDVRAFQTDNSSNYERFYSNDSKNLFNLRDKGNISFTITNNNLQICAPVKDMDISGLELKEGYKLTKKHIPDPVVLQPVKGGYLIITAWGDEASDPLVVNENFN